jgi:N-acyl-phosphatidylethanolamine-hydrolysing phospholipase D
MFKKWFYCISLLLLVQACSVDPKSFKYRNNYHQWDKKSFIKWKLNSFGLPKPPSNFVQGYNFPVIETNIDFLKNNKNQKTYTWVGHATGLLQLDGLNILTDPIFSERASPLSFIGPKRKTPLPFEKESLPPIDLVVISHNHYDHMDYPTLKYLAEQNPNTLFMVPIGLKDWFHKHDINNVEELTWWQTFQHLRLKITFVPVQHWSKRTFWDTNESLWGGWVIEKEDFSFFFAGDTGYSNDFNDIKQHFNGFDLATIPVGAYEPRWFMQSYHVNPEEAVKIHQDVGAKKSIGVHWGTFELTDESLDEPIGALKKAKAKQQIKDDAFILLKHGETYLIK